MLVVFHKLAESKKYFQPVMLGCPDLILICPTAIGPEHVVQNWYESVEQGFRRYRGNLQNKNALETIKQICNEIILKEAV